MFLESKDDLNAIFTIVLRNLHYPQWQKLLTEAQDKMLEEVQLLLNKNCLPQTQKKLLLRRLKSLPQSTTIAHRERIQKILTKYAE